MGRVQRGSEIGSPGGLTTLALVATVMLALGGCRRAAFALLPQAPMGPQRNADPFAPLGPPAAARAAEGKSPTVSTAAGKVDAGVSAASVLSTFFGGARPLFGIYGNFEETSVVAPRRDPDRKRAASPPASDAAAPRQSPKAPSGRER